LGEKPTACACARAHSTRSSTNNPLDGLAGREGNDGNFEYSENLKAVVKAVVAKAVVEEAVMEEVNHLRREHHSDSY